MVKYSIGSLTGAVKLYTDPTVILVPSRIDESVDEQLDPEFVRGSKRDVGEDHSKSTTQYSLSLPLIIIGA